MNYLYLSIGAFVLAFGLFKLSSVGTRPKGLPPGPPTLPLLGNLHQMPTRDAHLQFQKWAEEYGTIYSLVLGTKIMIVLSDDEGVKELFDRRSGIYSDRPELYVGQTLCSGGLRMLMMNYGPVWRSTRKMVHTLLNANIAKNYVPYQVLENTQMLYDFLQQPEGFLKHIRRYSNALTTTMVFGWRTPTYEDAKMQQLFDGFSEFAEINQTGAAALIDFYPPVRQLPNLILPTRTYAKTLHEKEKALYLQHWLNAKQAVIDGTIKDCFCVGMAEAQKREGFSDDQAAYTSGTLLEAGSDTTSNTIYAFMLAMMLYPDVQRRAQEEIDRIVGPDRMPTMEDQHSLQYIRGCMKETLRWLPTTILGAVPHACTKDDNYLGYLIPKGAAVMNNVWTINNDPKRAPKPREFNPTRYENDTLGLYDSASNPDAAKRDHFTFGGGRRICPGMHVAERSLFLAMSRILWSFDITPTTDSEGSPLLPEQDNVTQGFVCMPEEFKARIKPRSEKKADFIVKAWEQAQSESLDPDTHQWLA